MASDPQTPEKNDLKFVEYLGNVGIVETENLLNDFLERHSELSDGKPVSPRVFRELFDDHFEPVYVSRSFITEELSTAWGLYAAIDEEQDVEETKEELQSISDSGANARRKYNGLFKRLLDIIAEAAPHVNWRSNKTKPPRQDLAEWIDSKHAHFTNLINDPNNNLMKKELEIVQAALEQAKVELPVTKDEGAMAYMATARSAAKRQQLDDGDGAGDGPPTKKVKQEYPAGTWWGAHKEKLSCSDAFFGIIDEYKAYLANPGGDLPGSQAYKLKVADFLKRALGDVGMRDKANAILLRHKFRFRESGYDHATTFVTPGAPEAKIRLSSGKPKFYALNDFKKILGGGFSPEELSPEDLVPPTALAHRMVALAHSQERSGVALRGGASGSGSVLADKYNYATTYPFDIDPERTVHACMVRENMPLRFREPEELWKQLIDDARFPILTLEQSIEEDRPPMQNSDYVEGKSIDRLREKLSKIIVPSEWDTLLREDDQGHIDASAETWDVIVDDAMGKVYDFVWENEDINADAPALLQDGGKDKPKTRYDRKMKDRHFSKILAYVFRARVYHCLLYCLKWRQYLLGNIKLSPLIECEKMLYQIWDWHEELYMNWENNKWFEISDPNARRTLESRYEARDILRQGWMKHMDACDDALKNLARNELYYDGPLALTGSATAVITNTRAKKQPGVLISNTRGVGGKPIEPFNEVDEINSKTREVWAAIDKEIEENDAKEAAEKAEQIRLGTYVSPPRMKTPEPWVPTWPGQQRRRLESPPLASPRTLQSLGYTKYHEPGRVPEDNPPPFRDSDLDDTDDDNDDEDDDDDDAGIDPWTNPTGTVTGPQGGKTQKAVVKDTSAALEYLQKVREAYSKNLDDTIEKNHRLDPLDPGNRGPIHANNIDIMAKNQIIWSLDTELHNLSRDIDPLNDGNHGRGATQKWPMPDPDDFLKNTTPIPPQPKVPLGINSLSRGPLLGEHTLPGHPRVFVGAAATFGVDPSPQDKDDTPPLPSYFGPSGSGRAGAGGESGGAAPTGPPGSSGANAPRGSSKARDSTPKPEAQPDRSGRVEELRSYIQKANAARVAIRRYSALQMHGKLPEGDDGSEYMEARETEKKYDQMYLDLYKRSDKQQQKEASYWKDVEERRLMKQIVTQQQQIDRLAERDRIATEKMKQQQEQEQQQQQQQEQEQEEQQAASQNVSTSPLVYAFKALPVMTQAQLLKRAEGMKTRAILDFNKAKNSYQAAQGKETKAWNAFTADRNNAQLRTRAVEAQAVLEAAKKHVTKLQNSVMVANLCQLSQKQWDTPAETTDKLNRTLDLLNGDWMSWKRRRTFQDNAEIRHMNNVWSLEVVNIIFQALKAVDVNPGVEWWWETHDSFWEVSASTMQRKRTIWVHSVVRDLSARLAEMNPPRDCPLKTPPEPEIWNNEPALTVDELLEKERVTLGMPAPKPLRPQLSASRLATPLGGLSNPPSRASHPPVATTHRMHVVKLPPTPSTPWMGVPPSVSLPPTPGLMSPQPKPTTSKPARTLSELPTLPELKSSKTPKPPKSTKLTAPPTTVAPTPTHISKPEPKPEPTQTKAPKIKVIKKPAPTPKPTPPPTATSVAPIAIPPTPSQTPSPVTTTRSPTLAPTLELGYRSGEPNDAWPELKELIIAVWTAFVAWESLRQVSGDTSQVPGPDRPLWPKPVYVAANGGYYDL
ncbi:hypothetical protein F4808DRAFT_470529 [Astrocystis sublimbata]|nr:hypothetical protein F4808DRAFT_470529 [Astrocystis sublimbata]